MEVHDISPPFFHQPDAHVDRIIPRTLEKRHTIRPPHGMTVTGVGSEAAVSVAMMVHDQRTFDQLNCYFDVGASQRIYPSAYCCSQPTINDGRELCGEVENAHVATPSHQLLDAYCPEGHGPGMSLQADESGERVLARRLSAVGVVVREAGCLEPVQGDHIGVAGDLDFVVVPLSRLKGG